MRIPEFPGNADDEQVELAPEQEPAPEPGAPFALPQLREPEPEPREEPGPAAPPLSAQKKGQNEFVEFVEPHAKALKSVEILEKRAAVVRFERSDGLLGLFGGSGNVVFVGGCLGVMADCLMSRGLAAEITPVPLIGWAWGKRPNQSAPPPLIPLIQEKTRPASALVTMGCVASVVGVVGGAYYFNT